MANKYSFQKRTTTIIETILGPIALSCSLLDISSESEYEDMVHVFPLFDSELNTEYSLTIGTEYLGLPLPAKLEEMVVSVALPGVHLMWYLDIQVEMAQASFENQG